MDKFNRSLFSLPFANNKIKSPFTTIVIATLLSSIALASNTDLQLSVFKAPIAPDGTTAGAVTDFVVEFRNNNPEVPGIGLKKGGTVNITLPPEFKFVDSGKPVLKTTSSKTCGPPLISTCSSAVLLQGWPQSLIPPFPDVSHDVDTNTLSLTVGKDWMSAGSAAPGPKQIHFMGFGFRNPEQAGDYSLKIVIHPDPASSNVIQGDVMVAIVANTVATISPISLSNGKPPPPFANTLYQNVAAGDTSLKLAFYLWDKTKHAIVGADIVMDEPSTGRLVGADSNVLGNINMSTPAGAKTHKLVTTGPSKLAKAFLTGLDTGHLVAELETDPSVSGEYKIVFSLNNGNSVTHTITAK